MNQLIYDSETIDDLPIFQKNVISKANHECILPDEKHTGCTGRESPDVCSCFVPGIRTGRLGRFRFWRRGHAMPAAASASDLTFSTASCIQEF